MGIAIIPVLKGLISDIVSTLIDTDIFGHYYITKIILTGSFLKQSKQNDVYNYLIISEIEKEFKEQILRGRIYELKLNIMGLDTGDQYQLNETTKCRNETSKSSFYDIFLRGELRVVSSMMYWYMYKNYQEAIPVIVQEEELCAKRCTVDRSLDGEFS